MTQRMNLRTPKLRELTTEETFNTFKSWKEQLIYSLSLENEFKPFLVDGLVWERESSDKPCRGFTDDPTTVENGKTKEQKAASLNIMLGQIANFAPIISRSQITKISISLADVWEPGNAATTELRPWIQKAFNTG